MSKLRVHDMAGEFGVPSEEVIGLLRQMDVPVRSHMSALTDDQVARVRARWEREKRARAEKANAPAASRRRRGAASAVAAPAAPSAATSAAPAAEGAAPVRRRRRAEAPAAAPVSPAAEVAPTIGRRTAASVQAAQAAQAEADAAEAATAAAQAAEMAREQDDAEEEAASRQAEVEKPTEQAQEPRAAAAAAPARPAERPESRPAPPSSTARPMDDRQLERPRPAADNRPRPRPIVPNAPRPKPVASASPFASPRPIASAAPGHAGGGGGAGVGAGTAPARRDNKTERGGRRKKGRRGSVDQEAVTANISKTMSAMRGAPSRRGRRVDESSRDEMAAMRQAEVERERTTVRVNEFITVSELAQTLKITPTDIVSFAFKNLGLMVTINLRLDFDQIELIAGEFGFQAVREDEYVVDVPGADEVEEPGDLEPRPPVVTIMGHVDHGKTSLLDYIRSANVVAGEAGGITQHIGAYHVELPGGKLITFLDTPGHEAFTAMRARGAQVTDMVILVVAADDQVMPQTVEAISHARNAGVPIIVAINKIDLPAANAIKVKQDLLQHEVVVEEFGGNVLAAEISAKKGTNVGGLLEQVLLQAEMLDLSANPHRRAVGTVVEAQLDPGKGPLATVLVQNGTLKVGDDFICGMYSGRVRALLDERGRPVKDAGPAIPVQVLGFEGVPMAGDQLIVQDDASASREIAQRRQRLDREAKSRRTSRSSVSLEDFMAHASAGEKRALRIVIKADQGGPAEALADALQRLSNEEVQVEVIHRGVGAITESDILLAKASGAIIIGFHVRPDNNARTAAEREGVDIRLYRIIYEAVANVRSALEGLLRPEEREVVLGEAEVRETFKVPRVGVIAGCSVRSGIINRTGRVRVVRDGTEVYDGTIGSLKRFKDDVKEVREGFECGIGIDNFNDIKVGDVIECYRTEEVARTLASVDAS